MSSLIQKLVFLWMKINNSWMKINNSVVLLGLFCGFLTTLSLGPPFFFFFRAQLKLREEETEKKAAAKTGFLVGQLVVLVSTFFTPLHLVLGKPHTIVAIGVPYLFFDFFCKNFASTTRNSLVNLSIRHVVVQNLISQFLNYVVLPTSILVRLVNVYIFRYNNKRLFLISSVVGWLIGQIFFLTIVELVLVGVRQNKFNIPLINNFIRDLTSNLVKLDTFFQRKRARNKNLNSKFLVAQGIAFVARITSAFFFITCVVYLGIEPAPLVRQELFDPGKEKREEEMERKEEVESEEENANKGVAEASGPEKGFLSVFDYQRWNRPLRYINNEKNEMAVRTEISQYFFHICKSDGKEKIAFTYPPSLSIFLQMLKERVRVWESTIKKTLSNDNDNEFYNYWVYSNNRKGNKISKEFRNRLEALDKKSLLRNILETRTRLCNDSNDDSENKYFYFPKTYDPLLSGPYRLTMPTAISPSKGSKKEEISTSDELIKAKALRFDINRIYAMLVADPDYQDFDGQLKWTTDNERERFRKILSNEIPPDTNNPTESIKDPNPKESIKKPNRKHSIKIVQVDPGDEISKLVPQWPGGLISELDEDFRNFQALFDKSGNTESESKSKAQSKSESKAESKKKSISKSESKKKSKSELEEEEYDEQEKKEDEEEEKKDELRIHEISSRSFKLETFFIPEEKKENEEEEEEEEEIDNPFLKKLKKKKGMESLPLLRFLPESDFGRELIRGSERTQRRKVGVWRLLQGKAHSPLFVDRTKSFSYLPFDISKIFNFTNWTNNREEMIESIIAEVLDIDGEKAKEQEENARLEMVLLWQGLPFGHLIRGCALITQSVLRKYIILPSLIIAKNIGRILVFQKPEFVQDIEEWKEEVHITCSNDGVQISEIELPEGWWEDGMQIKIISPFTLKPWHTSKKKIKKNKKNKKDFSFLTISGHQAARPYGSPKPIKKNDFFELVFKQLDKKIEKWKRSYLDLERILVKLILQKFNPIFSLKKVKVSDLIKVAKSNQIKNEKDSTISNQIIDESFSLFESEKWKTPLLIKKNALTGGTSRIRNLIESMTKEKNKITPSGVYINPTEKGYLAKRFEWTTNIWQILKRRNISQLDCFLKIFLEKIYIDIFLSIINISRVNIQFLLESIKKMSDKPINETNQEKLNIKNKKIMNFISTLKKPINSLRNSKNLHSFCDLSHFSQAYVFYKLSQSRVSNKLRSFFQYDGMAFFIKAEIKDYLETQGIKLSHKKLPNSKMNEWKNWLLMGHGQSPRWYKLILQKCRNRDNLRQKNRNSKLDEEDKFEKNSKYDLLAYKSINGNYETKRDSSISKSISQGQLKKNKDIFSKYKTPKYNMSDIYIWRSLPIENFLDIEYYNLRDALIEPDRKYLDCTNLVFDFRYEILMESYIQMDTDAEIHENARIDANYYEIIKKFDRKELVYLTFSQKFQRNLPKPNLLKRKHQKDFWLGLNSNIKKKMPNVPNSRLGSWFFAELVLTYNLYKTKPWAIRSENLLLNLNINKDDLIENSEKKNIKKNQKQKGESGSNQNITNQNQKEKKDQKDKKKKKDKKNKKDKKDQKDEKDKKENESVESNGDLTSNVEKEGNGKSVPSTTDEKDIKDPSEKPRKKKKKREQPLLDRDIELRENRFLISQVVMNADWGEEGDSNLNLFSYLLTRKSNTLTMAVIQKEEINLELLPRNKKSFRLKAMKKMGVLDVEHVRLALKNDAQFIMHQTLGISLVAKIKHQINQVHRNGDKNDFDLLVPETILSHRRRRELRILISLNSKTSNKNPIFWTENNCSQSLDLDKENHLNLNKDKNDLIKFKLFLWPNYRLEDLACMNRYWFDTNNGSRFSMLRLRMYPRLKSR